MIKTVFVVGPTASGKTTLGIELAKRLDGEIVSADSMQIYKGIHIASAAPDEKEKSGIVHHLTEFLELTDEFSVAEYVTLARKCIHKIAEHGKLPIIVGGTGLYISSLLDNISFSPENTDMELRNKLEEKFDSIGGREMLKELSTFDEAAALKLHPNNRRRIIRAFEVYLQTGKTFTEQNYLSKQTEAVLNPIVIGINFSNRENLYKRINQRVDIMFQNGLLQEAETTYSICNNSKGAFQAIGHKELYGYFEHKCTLEEAKENLKRQTRRYAKRQITWFKRDKRINWVYPDDDSDYINSAYETAKKFLKEK